MRHSRRSLDFDSTRNERNATFGRKAQTPQQVHDMLPLRSLSITFYARDQMTRQAMGFIRMPRSQIRDEIGRFCTRDSATMILLPLRILRGYWRALLLPCFKVDRRKEKHHVALPQSGTLTNTWRHVDVAIRVVVHSPCDQQEKSGKMPRNGVPTSPSPYIPSQEDGQ